MRIFFKLLLLSVLSGTLSYAHASKYIMNIQKHLTELGFDPGIIDGKMGPNTRAAIRAFQKSIGRKPTGRATKQLYWQLKNAVNSCTAGFSQEAEEYNGIKDPD